MALLLLVAVVVERMRTTQTAEALAEAAARVKSWMLLPVLVERAHLAKETPEATEHRDHPEAQILVVVAVELVARASLAVVARPRAALDCLVQSLDQV